MIRDEEGAYIQGLEYGNYDSNLHRLINMWDPLFRNKSSPKGSMYITQDAAGLADGQW